MAIAHCPLSLNSTRANMQTSRTWWTRKIGKRRWSGKHQWVLSSSLLTIYLFFCVPRHERIAVSPPRETITDSLLFSHKSDDWKHTGAFDRTFIEFHIKQERRPEHRLLRFSKSAFIVYWLSVWKLSPSSCPGWVIIVLNNYLIRQRVNIHSEQWNLVLLRIFLS